MANIYEKFETTLNKKPQIIKFDEHTSQLFVSFEDGDLWIGEFIVSHEACTGKVDLPHVFVDGYYIQ
jgi:hypothetical protein